MNSFQNHPFSIVLTRIFHQFFVVISHICLFTYVLSIINSYFQITVCNIVFFRFITILIRFFHEMKCEEVCSGQDADIVPYFKSCPGYDDEAVRS